MKIMIFDSNGHLTIYETKKVRCIDNMLYFVSETEPDLMDKKDAIPMEIEFKSANAAELALEILFDKEKLNLAEQGLKAKMIASYDERRGMNYKARDAYFAKFSR